MSDYCSPVNLRESWISEITISADNNHTRTEVIRSLIDSVVLTPVDGQLQIDLRGELVGILSLCDTRGKPASQVGKRAAQIKMVAGACNHRELTLMVNV